MHIGLFGGSFNPIHNGHIQIARQVKREFQEDLLLVMVANDPPHKEIADGVDAKARFEMTRAALEDAPELTASDLELSMPGKSYTINTVRELKRLYPGARIDCIMGADMFVTLPTWHRAEELLKEARFLGVGRPDTGGNIAACAERLRADYGADVVLTGIEGPDISSTDVRELIEAAKPIGALVPDAAAAYIYENALYVPGQLRSIQEKLRQSVKPGRYLHTAGVMRMAIELAAQYGVNGEQARLAALLHDCAKLEVQEQYALAKRYHVALDGLTEQTLHGPVGAALARDRYGVEDDMVLDAIACHTLCRPGMTKLDKIIYLADKLEAGRDYAGVEKLREAAHAGLDAGMLACFAEVDAHLKANGIEMHPATKAAWEDIKSCAEKQ